MIIRIAQKKQQRQQDQQRLNVGQSLFQQIMGGKKQDSSAEEEELTFGKKDNEPNTDSMNYTKEQSQDLMPDSIQQDTELESKDRQLFGDSHKYESEPLVLDDNDVLDHSTGTFGQQNNLEKQLKPAKPERKDQSNEGNGC